MTLDENVSPVVMEHRPVISDLWSPVTVAEIERAKSANTTSAGPDGVSARLLKRMPNVILCRILNLIMWCEQASYKLLESETILIPKKSDAKEPGEFRPITVSSVIIRTLHKVLAKCMAGAIKLDQRQRAFRPTDGCSDNVFLVDMVLRYHRNKHRSLFMATLDIAKAFDSVTHRTIGETLGSLGLPGPMVKYVMNMAKVLDSIVMGGSRTQ